MTHVDAALVTRAAQHLTATRNHAALMTLCRTFAHVAWDFAAIVEATARAKDWTSAELMARTFEHATDDSSSTYSALAAVVVVATGARVLAD